MGAAISIRNRYQCHVGTKQPVRLVFVCARKFDTPIKILKLFMKYRHSMRRRRCYAHFSAGRPEVVSPANTAARLAQAEPPCRARSHPDMRMISPSDAAIEVGFDRPATLPPGGRSRWCQISPIARS